MFVAVYTFYRTGEQLGKMLGIIERELRRSFGDSASSTMFDSDELTMDNSQRALFTANLERSCAQAAADAEYQLGQVVHLFLQN